MWFYVAEGSGLSVNVGRTLVVADEEGTKLHYDEAGGDGPDAHVARYRQLRAEGYDSVQFVRHVEAWSPAGVHTTPHRHGARAPHRGLSPHAKPV